MRIVFSLLIFFSLDTALANFNCASFFNDESFMTENLVLNSDLRRDFVRPDEVYSFDRVVVFRLPNVFGKYLISPSQVNITFGALQMDGSRTLYLQGPRHEVLNQLIEIRMSSPNLGDLKQEVAKFIQTYPLSPYNTELVAAHQILEQN